MRTTTFGTLFVGTTLALASAVGAQDTVLFATTTSETTFYYGGVEAQSLREDEVAQVTPRAGLYSAGVFLSAGAQWAFIGDMNNNRRLVDAANTGPGDDTDAVFVKHHIGAPSGRATPRDLYYSKEGTVGFATSFRDGDVFRYIAQGQVETFVTEAQLLLAIGQVSGDIDVDAVCQSQTGDLFLSFETAEDVNGKTADDGGIVYIPTSAINYDALGNVSAINTGSAVVIATEAQIDGLIANSGVRTSLGVVPATAINLTALEIDPAGGTWNPPEEPTLTVANLMFAWAGTNNDGAIISTLPRVAGGSRGSIAMINGVPMGSLDYTTGVHMGLLPGSQGIDGIAGLALIAAQPAQLVVENHPTNLITTTTTLFSQQQVSGAVPAAGVAFLLMVGPTTQGSVLPVFSIPGFGGELFGIGSPIFTTTAVPDAHGFASQTIFMPPDVVGSGMNLAWQVFDAGTFSFGLPAPMQF